MKIVIYSCTNITIHPYICTVNWIFIVVKVVQKKNTTFVPRYKTLLPKPRELRKWIFILKLFVNTIVFTILFLKREFFLCFQHVIYC